MNQVFMLPAELELMEHRFFTVWKLLCSPAGLHPNMKKRIIEVTAAMCQLADNIEGIWHLCNNQATWKGKNANTMWLDHAKPQL